MPARTEPNASILRDLIFAAFVASLTLGAWVGVFTWFGDSSKLDTGFVTFLGGVLAVSGLLFRQYMLKEVLDYLKAWDKLSNLLREIIENASKQGHDENNHIKDFTSQETQAHRYSNYIRRELTVVPIVPIILIFLYGCALLSDRSLILREICLFLMIHLVAYLAIAAVTSTRLACAYPYLEKTIAELETLRSELETTKQMS
jgi:fumarate reductase subunit C